MNIGQQYHRFEDWQLLPVDYEESHEQHHCNNCGSDFTGTFCPTCGQKWSAGAVTWDSLRQGVMDIWGMGTRSLPYTLWQLMLRPGYLIGDYISGKRQVSFPPIKLLVLVAVVVVLVENYLNINVIGKDEGITLFNDGENGIDKWLSSHYDGFILSLFMLMLLPTHVVFRYSPRNTLHTLPQGFFIQVFQAIQFLCIMLFFAIFRKVFGLSESVEGIGALVTFLFFLFCNYKQLFGYSTWNTCWRMVPCGLLTLILLLLLVTLQRGMGNKASHMISIDAFLIILFLLISHVVNTINRCNSGIRPHRIMRKWYNILIMGIYGLFTGLILVGTILSIIGYLQNHDTEKSDTIIICIIVFFICASLLVAYIAEARKPDSEIALPSNNDNI